MHVHCLTSLSDFIDAQEKNLMSLIWEQRDIDFKILVLRILCVSPPVSGTFWIIYLLSELSLSKNSIPSTFACNDNCRDVYIGPSILFAFCGVKGVLNLVKKTTYFTMRCPAMSFMLRCSQKQCKLQSRITTFEIRNSTSEQTFLGFDLRVCPGNICVYIPLAEGQKRALIFWTRAIKIFSVAVITLYKIIT